MSENLALAERQLPHDAELAEKFGQVILEGMGVDVSDPLMTAVEVVEHEPFGVYLTEEYKGGYIDDYDTGEEKVAEVEISTVLKVSFDFR